VTESMCVQEEIGRERVRERESAMRVIRERGGERTSERERERERQRESEKQRAEVRVHGWVLNAKERVRCVGVCVDVERSM